MQSIDSLSETYSIRSPDVVHVGPGTTAKLKAFAAERSAESALVITDEGVVDAGVADSAFDALEAAGLEVVIYDGVEPEPKLQMAEMAAERLHKGDHDLVVGLGGGSSLDTAKLASVLAEHDRPVREMLGMGNVPGEGRELALLPTTAGTGSEMTHIGVFKDTEDDGAKKVVYSPHLFADAAIIDPNLTKSLPPAVAAATGMDALTHAIEAYVTTIRTPYTDVLAREAIELIGANLRPAVHQGAVNDDARHAMSLGATLAGQAFVNSGLGAVHALTYPLGMECDLGHGQANAVLLPYVMEYNVATEPERFAEIARLLGEQSVPGESMIDFAYRSVDVVLELNKDINIPTEIREFADLSHEDFERFAEMAMEYSEHNVERNPRTMDREDISDIFEQAY
ncbi:iron-containing alcohol dehydrogenase [Natrinema soli]|uniref:Iron-containing alcohol dehydrogenase n=1 Tax=Natrinema soli TaxID=1930624 RepID=A0ABD5SG46_9EURY|nr:iron-containing alcohol dehydrogenase [Natrinema soli]